MCMVDLGIRWGTAHATTLHGIFWRMNSSTQPCLAALCVHIKYTYCQVYVYNMFGVNIITSCNWYWKHFRVLLFLLLPIRQSVPKRSHKEMLRNTWIYSNIKQYQMQISKQYSKTSKMSVIFFFSFSFSKQMLIHKKRIGHSHVHRICRLEIHFVSMLFEHNVCLYIDIKMQ